MPAPMFWADRTFNFDYPVELFPNMVERLRGTPLRVRHMLEHLPEKIIIIRHQDKWSLKERVGHLIMVERLSNKKTYESSFNDDALEDLFERFQEVRNMFVEKLEHITLKQAALTAMHPRLQQPMRLVDLVYFAAEHDDHELTLMRHLLKTLLKK